MYDLAVSVSTRFGLIPPFSATEFRDRLAREKQCRILIEPHPMEGAIYGMCAPDGDLFVIYYHSEAGVVQEERIKYHELAHILFDHVTRENQSTYLRACLTSTLQDREAEAFARAITAYALGSGFVAPLTSGRRTTPGAHTLGRFLQQLGR